MPIQKSAFGNWLIIVRSSTSPTSSRRQLLLGIMSEYARRISLSQQSVLRGRGSSARNSGARPTHGCGVSRGNHTPQGIRIDLAAYLEESLWRLAHHRSFANIDPPRAAWQAVLGIMDRYDCGGSHRRSLVRALWPGLQRFGVRPIHGCECHFTKGCRFRSPFAYLEKPFRMLERSYDRSV
jgi:hypothetical protein